MREVPAKNYLILTFLAIGVVLISLILMNMYKTNNKEVYYSSVVKDVVNEIVYDDLDNYIQETPNFVLYINDSSKKNKKIQRAVKKIIMDNDIEQYVVYIEKTDDVIKKYSLDSNTPIFVAYENGTIVEIMSKDDYSTKDIESFFIRNKVIDND